MLKDEIEKKINLKSCKSKRKIAIKRIRIKFDRKKPWGWWNLYKNQSLKLS
jgi:hypothetical protein